MMAAELCKADLVSGHGRRFPELQGVMGPLLCGREKLPAAVADAIGDHYAPPGPNDRCPSAPISIAVALADKLEALVSFWSIGEKRPARAILMPCGVPPSVSSDHRREQAAPALAQVLSRQAI